MNICWRNKLADLLIKYQVQERPRRMISAPWPALGGHVLLSVPPLSRIFEDLFKETRVPKMADFVVWLCFVTHRLRKRYRKPSMTAPPQVHDAPSLWKMPPCSKAKFLSWHLVLKAEYQLEFLEFTTLGATTHKYECEHLIYKQKCPLLVLLWQPLCKHRDLTSHEQRVSCFFGILLG